MVDLKSNVNYGAIFDIFCIRKIKEKNRKLQKHLWLKFSIELKRNLKEILIDFADFYCVYYTS